MSKLNKLSGTFIIGYGYPKLIGFADFASKWPTPGDVLFQAKVLLDEHEALVKELPVPRSIRRCTKVRLHTMRRGTVGEVLSDMKLRELLVKNGIMSNHRLSVLLEPHNAEKQFIVVTYIFSIHRL